MKRKQLVQRLSRYCRANGIEFAFEPSEGKGSHGTVYVGQLKTTLPDTDLPPFYIAAILKQLKLPKDAI